MLKQKNVVETCRMRFLPCRSLQNLQYGFNWQPQAQQNGFPSTQLVWDTLLNIHVFTGAYFTFFFYEKQNSYSLPPYVFMSNDQMDPPIKSQSLLVTSTRTLIGYPTVN